MIVISIVTEVINLAYNLVSPCQFTLSLQNWFKKGLKVRLSSQNCHCRDTAVMTRERENKSIT